MSRKVLLNIIRKKFLREVGLPSAGRGGCWQAVQHRVFASQCRELQLTAWAKITGKQWRFCSPPFATPSRTLLLLIMGQSWWSSCYLLSQLAVACYNNGKSTCEYRFGGLQSWITFSCDGRAMEGKRKKPYLWVVKTVNLSLPASKATALASSAVWSDTVLNSFPTVNLQTVFVIR